MKNAPAVTLRRFECADIPFAQELRAIAGWNQTERDWAGYHAFEPEGCFIADITGIRAGTVTSIRYGDHVGWIGMVLVHPDHRRRGVGSALLARAIAYLSQCGVHCIKLDATPMGKKVYGPLGFRDEYDVVRYEGLARAVGAASPGEVFRLQPTDLASVAAFDEGAFGAKRARVLGSLSQREPPLCFVAKRRPGIAGYLIARPGQNAFQVGPWVANEATIANHLLTSFLACVPGQQVFVDVPRPNPDAEALMASHGFREQRPFTRMSLGDNAHPGVPALIYGTGGAEKG